MTINKTEKRKHKQIGVCKQTMWSSLLHITIRTYLMLHVRFKCSHESTSSTSSTSNVNKQMPVAAIRRTNHAMSIAFLFRFIVALGAWRSIIVCVCVVNYAPFPTYRHFNLSHSQILLWNKYRTMGRGKIHIHELPYNRFWMRLSANRCVSVGIYFCWWVNVNELKSAPLPLPSSPNDKWTMIFNCIQILFRMQLRLPARAHIVPNQLLQYVHSLSADASHSHKSQCAYVSAFEFVVLQHRHHTMICVCLRVCSLLNLICLYLRSAVDASADSL